jgi:outer membrane protein assembly factor BamE (lipoprotein component of BamABCDE complex)
MKLAIIASTLLFCCACSSPPPPQDPADNLTVGKVQGEIKVGMSAAAVAEVLGSPNIVTTDELRREVWVYDKVSSDRVDTRTSSYATLIILGASKGSSQSSTRQRTLTIIIKYDEQKLVRDFAYNFTQF